MIATAADFGVIFTLVELFHVWYVAAVAVGSATGAVINFLLNRHWSFSVAHHHWHGQAFRYTITSALSLLLNAGGVYLATDIVGIHYSISVVVVSVAVGWFFNYPMFRHFVFKY